MISQLTVFLENEKGRLASACRIISESNINMHTLFVADTRDFGIARIFCDTPESAVKALQKAGYRAALTQVIGVKVPNRKGGLAELLDFIDSKGIGIEYCYCYSVNEDFAIDVLRVSDNGIEDDLTTAGFELVKPEEVYALD